MRPATRSLGHGLYAGMKDWKPSPGGPPDAEPIASHPSAYKWGFVCGTAVQLACMIAFLLGVTGAI